MRRKSSLQSLSDILTNLLDEQQAGGKMVYGAIIRKGERYYTDLRKVFNSINNRQTEYNWLIIDCICYPHDPKIDELLSRKYCWLIGEELTDIINKESFNGYGQF